MGGNIPGGNLLGGKFPGPGGGKFSRGDFDGWEFSRGSFPRTLCDSVGGYMHIKVIRSYPEPWGNFDQIQPTFTCLK